MRVYRKLVGLVFWAGVGRSEGVVWLYSTVLGNFTARKIRCVEIVSRENLATWKLRRAKFYPGGIFATHKLCRLKFFRAEFLPRVILIFISVINNISFVFNLVLNYLHSNFYYY